MGCTSAKDKRVPANTTDINHMIGRSPYATPSTIQVSPVPFSTAGNLANGSVMLPPATVMTTSGTMAPPTQIIQPASPTHMKPNIVPSVLTQQSTIMPVAVNPPVSTGLAANTIVNPNLSPMPGMMNPFPNQMNTSMNSPLTNVTNQYMNAQPQIKVNSNQVEVIGGMKQAAKSMSFTPVTVNQVQFTKQTYDVNSNYAIESTNVGGVNSYMDQKKLDMNMDTGSTSYTPKIFTYTYGNMMGGPLVGQGGNASQYY